MENFCYHITSFLFVQGKGKTLKKLLLVRIIVPLTCYPLVTKTKEVHIMKNRTKKQNLHIYRHYRRPYPNAAEPSYFLNKLVDGMLAVVTGMGSVTFFLFLVTL